MEKALAGIRVLDFGRFIAAPYCGMILADMGAEVIRVDRPGGEQDRTYGLQGPNGENAFFLSCARNKKGITLDPRSGEEGREALHDLIRIADVVLHNFSPGAAELLGLSYEEVREAKPDIIYTAVSCYGSDGPYAQRVGFDPIAQTMSGSLGLNGFASDPPLRSQLPWVDYSTGLAAACGTLLAVRHRDRTGEGQMVDCALLQTAVSFMAPIIAESLAFGRERPRLGNRSPYLACGDLYSCKDGWVYISTITENMWRRFLGAVGQEELIEDPELSNDFERFEHRHRYDPKVAAWTRARTVDAVLEAMEKARIPCARFYWARDVPHDPQVRACSMLETVDLDHPEMREIPVSGVPVRLSKTPGSVERRPPRVGEHNREVYCDLLGYAESKLDELSRSQVI